MTGISRLGASKLCKRSDSVIWRGVRTVELNCAGGSADAAVKADAKQSRKSFAFII